MRFILIGILLSSVFGPVGCMRPAAPVGPTEQVVEVDDYEAFFTETVSLLRGYEWRMQRVDRPAGLIETRPATSKHFPEFWRIDSPAGYNHLESSLHTIRRTVTIRLEPLPAATEPASAATAESPPDSQPASADAAGPEMPVAATPPAQPADEHVAAAGPSRVRLQVEVQKERYSAPERQVTTASGAFGLFSQSSPTVYGYFRNRPGEVQWVLLGRDELLEADLLGRIIAESRHIE